MVLAVILFGCVVASAQEFPKAADMVVNGQPINIRGENYRQLFQELRDVHRFTQPELDALFAGVVIDRKVLELMDKQWEAKPYYEYWPLFIRTD